MNRRLALVPLTAVVLALLALAPFAAPRLTSAAPPQGFQSQSWILNLTEPTTIAFAPDGRMLILERAGKLWVAQPGATQVDPTPLLQITNINTDQGERGAVGLAFDPSFATNGFFYVFYTANAPLRDRISRFTASGNTAALSSEVTIWQDNVDAGFWHHGGNLVFGPDGKLYAAVGDHFDSTAGSANVSQRLDSYRGKILRLNSDGTAPSDNPFYDGAGPNLDAIWARGFRNPFRFSFDSATGTMYIGDNGSNTGTSIEEVDRGVAGANYGWPFCEGPCGTAGMTNPIYSYSHGGRDASVIGGFVYRGTLFPPEYRGSYFFADYAQNAIRRLTFDAGGAVTGMTPFEPADGTLDGPYGDITDLKIGPDGALYYVDIALDNNGVRTGPGSVRRIMYASANQAPTITIASASPTSGPGPTLAVSFTGAATDPEGAPLSYAWDFGDGATAATASVAHTYAARGRYTARLTVSDGQNQALSSPIVITVGTPPAPTITAPASGQTFRAGDVVAFSATATDPDGTLTASSYSWTIVFHHEGHIHPAAGPIAGPSGTFAIPTTGHDFSGNTSYELILTVTDSDGLPATASASIYPQKVNLTFDTSPPGLALSFDEQTNVTAPFVRDTLIGFQHTVSAPAQQTLNGVTYTFVSWSDGGAATHTVTVPATAQTYTATYQPAQAASFPTTTVLDTFNRANGALGPNWVGSTGGYSVASNRLDVGNGGDIYWNAASFGADQEAFVTFSTIDGGGNELDLLLKGQGTGWTSGVLEVWYSPTSRRVQVWTYTAAQGWVQRGADIPVTLVNGDRFGARATADGKVNVYQNATLLATRDVSAWTYAASGGRIGLWFDNASASLLDDFGGGTSGASSPTSTPTNTPTTVPATSTPTNTPTNTPTTAPAQDLIFAHGFESGALAGWTSSATDGGNLSVSAAATLNGAYGLQALVNDNNAMYVTDDTPAAEARYRARFYFDPNTIAMANNDAHYLFYGYSGASTVVLRIELRRSSNTYQLRAALVNDGTTWTTGAWTTISDAPHFAEIDWRASSAAGANNGGLTFWIDDVQRANLVNVDNDTRRIDRVRLGAVAGLDTGTRGTYYFDAFESRRLSYIGPAASGSLPTNTPTSTPTTVLPTNTPTSTPTSTPTQSAGGAPIVRAGSAAEGTITLSVAGAFQLDFTAASAWQPARWYDLATSSTQDLANKGGAGAGYNVLHAPVEFQYNGVWYNLGAAQSATIAILEETESRVALRTQYHLLPTSSDFLVQTDYTVYASGRVEVAMTLQNQSGASRTLGTVEYCFLNVEDTLPWTISVLNGGSAIAFQGSGPTPYLLATNLSADRTIDSDGSGNRYWVVGSQALAANAVFSRQWELQLVPLTP